MQKENVVPSGGLVYYTGSWNCRGEETKMAVTRAPLLRSLHRQRGPLLLRDVLSLGALLLLAFFPGKSEAQAPSPVPAAELVNRTDPVQARALNSIFRQWNLRPGNNTWNVTGDPCSGTAVDETSFNSPNINPSLKCVCSGGICRITQLKVYALNVVGGITDEFQNLTTIFDLNLAQNYLTGPLPAFIGNFTEMKWLSVSLNALNGPLPKELGNLKNLITFSSHESPSCVILASFTNMKKQTEERLHLLAFWNNLIA